MTLNSLSLVFLLQFLITIPCIAQTATAYLEQAHLAKLANHPYWLSLVHYQPQPHSSSFSYVSDVTSTEFFLAQDGVNNPAAELMATINAFFKVQGDDQNQHAQCRFPARYNWLKKVLGWSNSSPHKIACDAYQQWSLKGHVDSLSLVFATGYLGNPASFYGHLLLKFNADRTQAASQLLDQSINFGAIVLEGENPVVYVLKGLFGGYDATFSHEKFYRFNHNYAENELRDLWEYQLNLTQDEVEQIVSHSWELLGKKFRYFYLKENCAYQVAELLELVVEQPLLPRKLPWSIPATVFDGLVSIERDGQPLVSSVHQIPSRQNSLYKKYATLDDRGQLVVHELVENELSFELAAYQGLDEIEKILVVDTLLDYYEFLIVGEKSNQQYKHAKHKVLIERSQLPIQPNTATREYRNTAPPHEGPLPGMTRIGMFFNSKYGVGTELQLRPVYYDSLGHDAGRLANSNLTMFDLKAAYIDQDIYLRRLDLVNVETLNLTQTSLPGDGGMAWKLKIGLDNQDLSCIDCLSFNVTGGLGHALALTPQTVMYGMLEGRLQTEYQDSGLFTSTARIAMISTPVTYWKSHLSLSYKVHIDGDKTNRPLFRWENRFGLNREWDLRLLYLKDVESEVHASVSLYW